MPVKPRWDPEDDDFFEVEEPKKPEPDKTLSKKPKKSYSPAKWDRTNDK